MDWLFKPEKPYTWGFLFRVIGKAGLLFLALNAAFILCNPLSILGRVSLYNTVIPGRERLPYGENPAESYNLSMNNLNAMFASHTLAESKADNEFRVLLVGDSATWGFLLKPEHTLAGQLNTANLTTEDGREIRFYNVGYPTMSLTKDLLLLDKAMSYEPDLVIWLVTLQSFPRDGQLEPALVQNNPDAVRNLIETYNLNLDPDSDSFEETTFPDNTIPGQRRPLADLLRLQLYGVMWTTTGIDQYYPESYDLRQSNFDTDVSWQALSEPDTIPDDYLAFDVLQAGIERTGDVPLILVNEPMFISQGRNSDLRYNFFYPRWVYDAYRVQMRDFAAEQDVLYLDMWNRIPASAFTDSPVHMAPRGTQQFASLLIPFIQRYLENVPFGVFG